MWIFVENQKVRFFSDDRDTVLSVCKVDAGDERVVEVDSVPPMSGRYNFVEGEFVVDEEATAAGIAKEAALQLMEVQNARRNEYPPITDYLDGVVKGDQGQIDAYIAACQAVKLKYPKPE